MKKIGWIIFVYLILAAACGCGQTPGSGDSLRDSGQEAGEDSVAAEDPYAIYQRLLKSEESLYFREDTYFDYGDGFRYDIEADRPYEFYEICNIINMVSNSTVSVNELSDCISYAYLDCGVDGDVELVVLFQDLDYQDEILLVVKNLGDRLEVCYSRQFHYKDNWQIANRHGWVTNERSAGTGLHVEERGCILADGVYHEVYSALSDYNYHILLEHFSIGIPDDELYAIALKRYFIWQGESCKEYNMLAWNEGYSGDTFTDLDALSKAVMEASGMELYSYEEIHELIANREDELGVTEEIKNGPELQWISLDEKSYDLIYGVEATPGVSDKTRAIEAFKRFLSDKGHFKEILGVPMSDVRTVNNDGMIDGFFIKDLDCDDIPELLIGMMNLSRQYVVVYKFDTESGRVKKDYEIDGLSGQFGCDEELYNLAVAADPEFADSLLLTEKFAKGYQRVGYNDLGQLVWFVSYMGNDDYFLVKMYWCNFNDPDRKVSSYTEYGGYDDSHISLYYAAEGSRSDAVKALKGYKPCLFYDVTRENIEKYVIEDYLGAGMEQYGMQELTDDLYRFYESYEEYYQGDDIKLTGSFHDHYNKYGILKYNIDHLMQMGFY